MVIELQEEQGVQAVLQAIKAYKTRLRSSIKRGTRRLMKFEKRYGVDTTHFLHTIPAEDLEDGDLEYIEWAGEARLLDSLQTELSELENTHVQFP